MTGSGWMLLISHATRRDGMLSAMSVRVVVRLGLMVHVERRYLKHLAGERAITGLRRIVASFGVRLQAVRRHMNHGAIMRGELSGRGYVGDQPCGLRWISCVES